ncbi:MAG TPA: hypothetical protein VEL05_00325, partial [Candidatus Acidoferrum sp.]|nr:hypothetical protein [Candidatus Acidoferrum sp.]
PFSWYASCRDVYEASSPGLTDPLGPALSPTRRVRHDHITRNAGDVVRARAHLYLIGDRAEFLPIIVERWAAGARAAVVFTDHADRTDPDALRALLYGTSDPDRSVRPSQGFFGHGLKITKTFFARPGMGSLEDPEARQLADELVASGSEVGSHSITPKRDPRSLVAGALADFSRWHTVTWIDHQPDTNCEAISSRGWRDDGPYGIHDLLARAGFRWVWSASDVPEHGVRVRNVFEPDRPGAALPPIYPLPSDPRLWVFESSWFYAPIGRLSAAFNQTDLDRLEQERGLFVGHTYLSTSPRTTRRRDYIASDAVLPRLEGGFALDPGFEEGLARLGQRVARGTIASLTLAESSERLRALAGVVVRYRADGSAVVTNTSSVALKSLTLAIPAEVDLLLVGAPPAGSRREPGRTTIWFDLPARRSVVVTTRAVPSVSAGGEHGLARVRLGVIASQALEGRLP